MKLARFIIVLLALALPSSVWAVCGGTSPTWTAANATQAEVQLCITAAVAGDTINVPAGNPAAYTQPLISTKGVSLIGAGEGLTNIILTATDFLEWAPTSAAVVKIAGFTISGTPNTLGVVNIDGVYTSLRIHHLTFNNIGASPRAFVVGYQNYPGSIPPIYGLIDHITYNNNVCGQFALVYGKDVDAWTGNDNLGTNQALYFEDSIINFNVTSGPTPCEVVDQEHGSRAVIRYNTIKNGVEEGHDTGSTAQSRGLRIKEVYKNVFTCTVTNFDCGGAAPLDFRGGLNLFFDNVIPICITCASGLPGWESANQTEIYRVDAVGGSPWNWITRTLAIAAPATGAVRSANVVTITTTAAHGFAANNHATIAGVTDASFNANGVTITGVSGLTFTYAQTGANATSGNGTVVPTENVANDFRSHCDTSPFSTCGASATDGQACTLSGEGQSTGICRDHPIDDTKVPAGVVVIGPTHANNIDGSGAGGYPSRDQVGRGKDSADHVTQAISPSYWWNNTDPNISAQISTLLIAPSNDPYLKRNREVFLTNPTPDTFCAAGGAACTKGVGRGAESLKPGNCSNTDFPASFPATAYWATDTNRLWQCTGTNAWAIYYVPYAYPHPLQGLITITAPAAAIIAENK